MANQCIEILAVCVNADDSRLPEQLRLILSALYPGRSQQIPFNLTIVNPDPFYNPAEPTPVWFPGEMCSSMHVIKQGYGEHGVLGMYDVIIFHGCMIWQPMDVAVNPFAHPKSLQNIAGNLKPSGRLVVVGRSKDDFAFGERDCNLFERLTQVFARLPSLPCIRLSGMNPVLGMLHIFRLRPHTFTKYPVPPLTSVNATLQQAMKRSMTLSNSDTNAQTQAKTRAKAQANARLNALQQRNFQMAVNNSLNRNGPRGPPASRSASGSRNASERRDAIGSRNTSGTRNAAGPSLMFPYSS